MLSNGTKLLLCKQAILVKLDYCNSISCKMSCHNIKVLDKIANFCFCVIYNFRKRKLISLFYLKSHIYLKNIELISKFGC